MIASLADAWKWYTSVRDLTRSMKSLGTKYWDALPWDGPLGQDNRLRELEASKIADWSGTTLDDLDDLCVLLLFSVFESIVRERALTDVAAELPPLRHPALQHAVKMLNETLEHGSFSKVTEAYKSMDPDLTEQVNQIRKYRNWVAHGRRGSPENTIDPSAAFERLQQFLDRLDEQPQQQPHALP